LAEGTRTRTARREDVLAAAERLFSERGYHQTSMADIGADLGLRPGSLYAHIESKEELLFEIVARAAREFEAATRPARDRRLGARERLRLGVRGHLQVLADHRDGSRVFLTEWRFLTGERLAAARVLRDRYEELWREILADGRAEGAFTADLALGRMAVLSVLNWSHQWFRPDGRLGPEAVADELAAILLDGLGHRRTAAEGRNER
jgi:AcrR family transcriptional regulator